MKARFFYSLYLILLVPYKTWKWYRARWKMHTLCGLLVFTGAIYLSHRWVKNNAQGLLYTNAADVPPCRVGLVLGSSKTIQGRPNLYFRYRIEAAASLYHSGKVKHLLVSGDNHKAGYDEATDMHDALVAAGVPDSCITMDFAGFRTLDSVVRCKYVFGQEAVVIISQQFHNERALFIAQRYGIKATGFNAKDVPARYSMRTTLREYVARLAAVADLYVFHTAPKFLGKKVVIPV